MTINLSSDQISIVLTCTIDVRGIPHMQRSDTGIRLADYQRALARWLDDAWIRNIILVENSGYPLDTLIKQVRQHPSGKYVEFLSFDGQGFQRHLGKGYGETLALQHVAQKSHQLRSTGRFLKVNGRYYVPNIVDVLSCMDANTGVFCNLNKSMTFSDSRLFGGDLEFLGYVCREGLQVDDSRGHWLEHALAKAVLHAIADGKTWKFICRLPVIEGVSGTINDAYVEPVYKQYFKGLAHAVKQRLLRW